MIELGPGDGTLARDIRSSLGVFSRQKLDYHFVEISPHLAKRQQEKNKGTWHATLSDTLVATRGAALIISNEFFDAFPVTDFQSLTGRALSRSKKGRNLATVPRHPQLLLIQRVTTPLRSCRIH